MWCGVCLTESDRARERMKGCRTERDAWQSKACVLALGECVVTAELLLMVFHQKRLTSPR